VANGGLSAIKKPPWRMALITILVIRLSYCHNPL